MYISIVVFLCCYGMPRGGLLLLVRQKASLPAAVAAALRSTLTSALQTSFRARRNIQTNTQTPAIHEAFTAMPSLYFVNLESAGFQAGWVLSAQVV